MLIKKIVFFTTFYEKKLYILTKKVTYFIKKSNI